MSNVHGNISHAMRDNYAEFGVDHYYRKVAATYRNPFMPGIRKRWWAEEGRAIYGAVASPSKTLHILDMAAGSGEATLVLQEWADSVRGLPQPGLSSSTGAPAAAPMPHLVQPAASLPVRAPFIPPNARRAVPRPQPGHAGSSSARAITPPQAPERHASFRLDITATDPYTAPAYTARTGGACHALSFADLAAGQVPPTPAGTATRGEAGADSDAAAPMYDLVVCSFALHLLTNPSELFALLDELSRKARWLVVVAPHKKPEVRTRTIMKLMSQIKETWGWARWDMAQWAAAGDKVYRAAGDDDETELQVVRDKVKLRLYRSHHFDE